MAQGDHRSLDTTNSFSSLALQKMQRMPRAPHLHPRTSPTPTHLTYTHARAWSAHWREAKMRMCIPSNYNSAELYIYM